MSKSTANPFVLPGLGQAGDPAQNPMLARMEMMRHAWQSLAGAGGAAAGGLAAPAMSAEDLDRRINELRTVENWLSMNLSMLSSTIQGLEVQRATIATLRAFVSPQGVSADADNPTALEVALGLKPSGQARIKPANGKAAAAPSDPAAAKACDNWWTMLQTQFDALASATAAASAPYAAAAEDAVKQGAAAAQAATASVRPQSSAQKSARKTAAAKPARKAAPRKRAAPRKAAAS